MNLLAISFTERLVQWDQSLFKKINSGWTNPFFDFVMPWLRTSLVWAPLYLFFAVFMFQNFKVKGLWWAVFFISTVALTDMTGTYAFKKAFMRLRPCADPDFGFQVRMLLKQCAGGFSFVSNHAANHFGMAAFFFVTLHPVFKKWTWLAFAWAGAIIYAQVYVGVHYPIDVFAGALLGLAFGITTGTFFNKRFGLTIFDNQSV